MLNRVSVPGIMKNIADVCALIGGLILLSGGLYFHDAVFGSVVVARISEFGIFFIPLLLLGLFAPDIARRTRAARAVRSIHRWLLALPERRQTALYGAIIGLTGALHIAGIIRKYLSFRMDRDLAIQANACANYLMASHKGDTHLLADHFEPFLMLFSPLCARFDPSVVVLVGCTLFWIIGAVGIYRIARSERCSFPVSLAFSWLYLVFWGHVNVVYFDSHLLALAVGFLPWIVWSVRTDRFVLFCILAILYMGLKENAALTIAGFGVLMILTRRYVKGAAVVAAGFTAFVVIMTVVYPYFTKGEGTVYFAKYYGHIGGTMREFLLTSLTRPFYVLSTVITVPKMIYLLRLFAPFAFIHFLRPVYLVPILPSIMINVLSNWDRLISMDFNYESEIFPYLFATSVILAADPAVRARLYAISRLPGRWLRMPFVRPGLSARVVVITVLFVFFSGSSPAFHYSFNRPEQFQIHLRMMLPKLIDRADRVAAIEKVAPHLSHLRHIYYLNEWEKSDKIVIAYPDFQRLWQYGFEEIETKIVPQFDEKYELWYRDARYPLFRVWKRKASAPLEIPPASR